MHAPGFFMSCRSGLKAKTPLLLAGFSCKELGDDLLSHTKSTLSLAQVRFTALFEMGRGGSKPLLSPNITGNVMPDISLGICDMHSAEL